MTINDKETDFFALARQVVGETNAANLRQMETASHAVVASYAAETYQQAIALTARTLRDVGQNMLKSCNELREEMEADPLSEVMFQAAYMQSARALVELIAVAGGLPLDVAAKNAAKVLKCEPNDLLVAEMSRDIANKIGRLKSDMLLGYEDSNTLDETATPRKRKVRSNSGLGVDGTIQ